MYVTPTLAVPNRDDVRKRLTVKAVTHAAQELAMITLHVHVSHVVHFLYFLRVQSYRVCCTNFIIRTWSYKTICDNKTIYCIQKVYGFIYSSLKYEHEVYKCVSVTTP